MSHPATASKQKVACCTKVLFVLPSLSRAGAETQTIDLVNGLGSTRFEKHLVTFEKNLDQQERIDTKNVRFTHSPRRSKFDRSPAKEIGRIIDEQRIDVVHCSLQMALLMGWLAVRRSRRKPKLIVALHTTLNRNLKNELFDRLLYQWLMRDCDKVICVCRAQERYWLKKFPFLTGRTRTIYNGIDTEKFKPDNCRASGKALRDHLGIPIDAKVICHIAGFRPEKGHAILLEAFAMLAQGIPDTFLMFVGDGALRSKIEERVHTTNLTDRVYFLGNQKDVRPALSASDCSVLASTAETFSIAMLESLAMGVPMVASNIGGTSEAVVHGRTGLLVPAAEPMAMADALSYMLKHQEKRLAMGAAGRTLVMTEFTPRSMVNETECTLIEVVSNL